MVHEREFQTRFQAPLSDVVTKPVEARIWGGTLAPRRGVSPCEAFHDAIRFWMPRPGLDVDQIVRLDDRCDIAID